MKVVVDKAIPFLKGVLEPYCDAVVYLDGREISSRDVRDADALLVRTRTTCGAELLEGSSVSLVATATIGTDHIDIPWCESRGVAVGSAAGCNSHGVAQYVTAALCTLHRRGSLNLRGLTVGVVGVGNVGSKVASYSETLGMKVLLCDPPRAAAEGPEGFVPLEELLRGSDIVTVHVPYDSSTHNMICGKFISAMKPGAVLVNSSRGGVMDPDAVAGARLCGRIGSLVVDTWPGEPDIPEELLSAADIATPHIAGYSFQGKQNASAAVVRAFAEHFGISDLKDFMPLPDGHSLRCVTIGDDMDENVAAVLDLYDIEADSRALKSAPAEFEHLRNSYVYRDEIRLRRIL
ncbi:MAG: 4-phosphoerythronate dehydrogenase [Bacteroidales bacterium]|nr:4-phosphoerythronate dehydrogenase [Bacteroidales bacterium]